MGHRVLITGGAGFIGSHLAEKLLAAGNEVIVIDDLSTGQVANLARCKGYPHFSYFLDSIFNRQLLTELIDSSDMVLHLAAAVGVRLILESPVRTIETNVKGTELVLELASKKKKLVLITSTSEVYGKSAKVPYSEDDDMVLGPTYRGRWAYACSKALDEFLALAYWRERKVPCIIARLFNTVGPRQTGRYGMVVPRFVQQALAGEPITVYGTGEQSRTFGHVADVVDALVRLVDCPKAVGEIFNVGGQGEITITGLAQKVKILLNSSSPIQYVPYEQAYEGGFEDMYRRVPDISKIRALVGYQPTHTLDEIILDVAKQQQEQRPWPPLQ